MNWKKSFLLGTVSLFSVVLVACGGGGSTDDSKSASSGDGSASGEQVITVSYPQEMSSADLSIATDEISFTTLNNVYEGLYRLDKDSQPQPAGAAEMAEVSEDGLTYTVKLNEKSKWTNGDPVVAADYVYGWQRTVDPATASEYAYLFESVKNASKIVDGEAKPEELGIKAISDYELEITLESATPYFDYLLAFPSFFPQNQKVVEQYGKDYAQNSENAVYNGPFVLQEFDGPGTDTDWVYAKNADYWDADTVQLETINVNVIKEAPTALNLFEDGQSDDVILSGELAQQMANDPSLVIQKEASTYYLELNQREDDSQFRNADLRKAISYALDRDAIADNILGDGSVAATGLVPSEMSFNPDSKEDFTKESGAGVSYDLDKAKEHWEKAKKDLGVDTVKIDLLASDDDKVKKVIEYIQGTLQDNLDGMEVTVSPVPLSVRLDRANKGDFSTVLSGWGADYADPSSYLDLFVTGNSYNRGRYSSADYDKLVKSAATTNANDPEARWEDMLGAEKVIMEDQGVIPVYQRAEAHLRSEKVKGLVAHAAGAKYDYKWTYVSE